MKRITTLVLGLAAAAWASAAAPLLSPAELNALLKDGSAAASVRVIDIRDPKSYATAHLPGAVSAPYGAWRGPATNPGELPDLPKLTALVQKLGLTPQTHAVVVSSGADATDFGSAARVYWTLKVLGLKELSVLNGGVKAWAQAGLAQDAQAVTVAASSFAPQIDRSLVASRDELKASTGVGGAVALVDARPAAFFNGETRHAAARTPGTLPGAVNVEHARWFAPGSATFVPTEDAKKIAAALNLDPQKDTVSFCNTGHWAATNWFAMSEVLGQKNVKLYAGSMVDWTQDGSELPMDNVPGRAQQLLIDARLWAERTFK